jgi:GNAT superfamily N-acetyltransferase
MAATQETNTPQTTPTASWTLAPVTADDMEALVDVHTAAFRSDLFSHLMLLGRPDGAHQALMRKSLEHWFGDPRASLTKAVDAEGHIVAWACWVLRDNDSMTTKAADDDEKEKKTTGSPLEAAAAPKAATTTPATAATGSASKDDPARMLGGRMRADVLRREAAYMPRGTAACLVLQALATEPGLQGRGIASQLVVAGTERADAESLPCWAHASPAGRALYARNGFREVARDDYPLAAWAPGGEGANRGWGTYTFRYMLRPVGGDESRGGV